MILEKNGYSQYNSRVHVVEQMLPEDSWIQVSVGSRGLCQGFRVSVNFDIAFRATS